MRSQTGSGRIVVENVAYSWRAKREDGSIWIWPVHNIGPYLKAGLGYRWIQTGKGKRKSAGDQTYVSSRIVRLLIEHAISKCGYDPLLKGDDVNLGAVDDVVPW